MTAPPGYSEQHADALATTFGTLNLADEAPKTPQADTCLAHLRLLFAFEKLKTQTGYQDGLWDIWDSRAGGPTASNAADILVKLREKRWAVYVARAVDRYEAWWKSFVPHTLKEKETMGGESADRERYEGFTENKPIIWKEDMLPPLGKYRAVLYLSWFVRWSNQTGVRCSASMACSHAESKAVLGGQFFIISGRWGLRLTPLHRTA